VALSGTLTNRGLRGAAPPQPKVLRPAFLFSVMATDKHRFSQISEKLLPRPIAYLVSSALLLPQLSTINYPEATSTSGIFVFGG
jgi:hypothetical protein